MVPWLETVTAVVMAGCVDVGIVVVAVRLVVMVVGGILSVVAAEIICGERVVSGTLALTFVISLALSSKFIVSVATIGSVLLVTDGALFPSVSGTVFSLSTFSSSVLIRFSTLTQSCAG